MKLLKVFSFILAIIMLQMLQMPEVFAKVNEKTMTILFTHDMHDHFLSANVEQNKKVMELGGYARLQSAIQKEKDTNPNAILIDGGDFSMGTLFQSIYPSDAPELRIMGHMGYDVLTLGNHEFDFRPKGLTDSLKAANKSGEKLPQIVQSNIEFPVDKNGNMTESVKNLREAMQQYAVKDYIVIERNGIKIGVFGLMGQDAVSCAPMAEVKFANSVESAKRVVKLLQEKEKVDLIICLSHSGIFADKSKSEDEILAKKVPEIDIIISGHTHTKLNEPIIIGKTIIGSCGEYSENLGVINISQDGKNRWKLDNYKLMQIDDKYKDDIKISEVISNYKSIVQKKYLDSFGMKFDEVLAKSSFNFIPISEIESKHEENTLGNLISDAYVYAVKKAEGDKYEKITAAIVPSGTIRGSFVKGNITVSDAFNASSLGVGKDQISGYPLISVYLTGKELKTVCEVDASISSLMSGVQLYMSGISFEFNPNRLIFNKVTKAAFQNLDGVTEEIDDKKLYRTIVGLYSAQMLSVVGDKSFGLLSIVPKTKEGVPIKDFEAYIIKDITNGRNNEVKEWVAIAEYLKSFEKVDGVPQISQYYNETHGRKIVHNNRNIVSIMSKPNKIALGIYGGITTFIGISIFVVLRIIIYRKVKNLRKDFDL